MKAAFILNKINRRLPFSKRQKSVRNFVHLNFCLSLFLALTVFVVGVETATGSVVRFMLLISHNVIHSKSICRLVVHW